MASKSDASPADSEDCQIIPISFYRSEREKVVAVQAKAATLGYYNLDFSKALRLMIRVAEISRITKDDIEHVRTEISRRRKSRKKES